MGNKLILIIAFLFLGSLLLFGWLLLKPDQDERTFPEKETTSQATPTEPGCLTMEEDIAVRELVEKVPIPASMKKEMADVVTERYMISGHVIDKESGEPVRQFLVQMTKDDEQPAQRFMFVSVGDEGSDKDGFPVRKNVDNEEGRFSIAVEKEGRYLLRVTAKGYLNADYVPIEIPGQEPLHDLVIRIDPALSLSGVVLDDITGIPIEEAKVTCSYAHSSWRDKDGNIVRHTSYSSGKTKTNREGRFSITDLRPGVCVITAAHPRYARSTVDAAAGTGHIEIRMNRGFRIFGRVFDDTGMPAQGIEIVYKGNESFRGGPYHSDGEGYYQTDLLPACRVRVKATAPKQNEGEPVLFTEEAYRVEVTDHDVELNFGPKPNHVTWKGTFYGWECKPVSKGQIRIWNDWIDNDLRDVLVKSGASIHRRITCDSKGRFEVHKLTLGTYRVDMGLPGERTLDYFGERDRIKFKSPGIVEMDLYLRRTEISGTIVEEGTGKPVKVKWGHVSASKRNKSSRSDYYSQRVSKDGTFRFRGLPPGTYSLQASLAEYPAVSYGKIELGENQIIDDLMIVVPADGKLRIKVTDLKQIEGTIIGMEIQRSDGTTVWTVGPGRYTKGANWEIEIPHEVGSWILVLSDVNMGKVVRPYDIIPSQVTDIVIKSEEFKKVE